MIKKIERNGIEIDKNEKLLSKDIIFFNCQDCGKEVQSQYSNFKLRKHFLCISCTRKKTVTKVHKERKKQERKKINQKISKNVKKTMATFSKEKKEKMYNKMKESMDWKTRNKHWNETMSKKSIKEKKEIYKKVSETMKKHYQEQGPWNLSNKKKSILNKATPENKWFIRGKQSSNEKIIAICSDCKNKFISRRANLAKQEEKHPGEIYCLKCKVNDKRNPGYIDGRKFNGKDSYTLKFFDNEFRQMIIKKQDYVCPICEEELEQGAHLHHIDYDKKNDNKDNLIFLHSSCHMRTNFNREFWKIFFGNYYKNYYDPLYIPIEFVEQYFNKFPLINHKFSLSYIENKLKFRRNFNKFIPPSTKGHNISKMLNNKYFYSRKRKNNSSIIEILTSKRIKDIYNYGDSLSKIINNITSKLYSFPVSLFSHHIMDWILRKWSNSGETIYDPAGGFGGRLIGTYYYDVNYITTDPWTFDELEKINNLLNLDAIIHNKKSEELKISCDMVVSCPPYFNDENYENIEQRDYQTWLKEYWEETIKNITAKKFVLIISKKYPEMIDIVSSKWIEKERFEIINKSFNSINKEYIIYFEK